SIVEKSGSWYSFEGERLGQGKDRAAEALLAKPELLQTVKHRIVEVVEGKVVPPVSDIESLVGV
ncbi:MAG: hypothetical protein JSV66_02920, partial [Trueperaceae bacterium]